MLFVKSSPMRHHVQKPTVEKHCPVWIVTRNPTCQLRNTILLVPIRKMEDKLFQRVVDRDTVGMQVTVHIPVPHCDSFTLRIQQNTVLCSLVQRTETEIKRTALPVFHFTHLSIVAKLITPVHKFFGLHIEILLFCQTAFLSEPLALLIHIPYHLTNQHRLPGIIIPMYGPPDHLFFGNTGKKAVLRQPYNHRLQIIIPPPSFLHRLKSFPQGSLIHQCQRIFCRISRNSAVQWGFFRHRSLPISHLLRHPKRLRKIKRHGVLPIERCRIITQP